MITYVLYFLSEKFSVQMEKQSQSNMSWVKYGMGDFFIMKCAFKIIRFVHVYQKIKMVISLGVL